MFLRSHHQDIGGDDKSNITKCHIYFTYMNIL